MKTKLKILISIAFAFITSSLFANTVFIAGTPYINEPFIAEVRNSPGVFVRRTTDYIASMQLGLKGVEEYQQKRVGEYITQNTNSTNQLDTMKPDRAPNSPLQPPTRPEDFKAQGYKQTGSGVYKKMDTNSKTLFIYVGADAKFEKRNMNISGKEEQVWVQL